MSGKGGVGKSSITALLAKAMQAKGLKVGVLDADITGPSIPRLFGLENEKAYGDGEKQIFPVIDKDGIKTMSINYLIEEENTPVIWRGPIIQSAIQQFYSDVLWEELDVLFIDMPPGTGDIQITLSQRLHFDGAVIVSTPQDIALIDAVKGVNMFKKVNVPILGIIENMSYYICEKCGHRADIFGHEGARKTAEKLGETFLGEIPLHLDIRENADNGTPIVFAQPESPHTKAYEEIAAKVAKTLGLV